MDDTEQIRLELMEKDAEVFRRLSSKLTKAIEDAVVSLTSDEVSEPPKATIEEVVKIGQSYVQAKVQKPSIQNEKLIAQIATEYATAQEKLEMARKTRAEAEAIEIDNAVKKLKAVIETAALLLKIGKTIEDKSGNQSIRDLSKRNS